MREMGIKAQWIKPWTTDGFVYLNCIMDLYSRKIIAWTLADSLEVSTVISTIIHSHCDYMSPNDYEKLYMRVENLPAA